MTDARALKYVAHAALPAWCLLYGLLFCLGGAYFLGTPWTSLATQGFYGVLMVWGAWLVWCRRHRLSSSLYFGDGLGVLFLLLVMASLVLHEGLHDLVVRKHLQFIPFFVILPYLVGRILDWEELSALLRGIEWMGPAALVLAAINYWVSPETVLSNRRWVFFGYDHSPLLLGFVLAGSLIAMAFRMLTWRKLLGMEQRMPRVTVLIMFSGCLITLVLVTARGTLGALLLAMLVMLLAVRQRSVKKKLLAAVGVAMILSVAFLLLPQSQGQMYAQLSTGPASTKVADENGGPNQSASIGERPHALLPGPILGEASCAPLVDGMNSVAMRWVLYREALDIFLAAPVAGVGAAMFGKYSCSGEHGFPHSTVLQALAELGVVGAVVLLGLMVVAFAIGIAGVRMVNNSHAPVLLAFLVFYIATDQIYGNYFMSVGTYFFIGLAGALRNNVTKDFR